MHFRELLGGYYLIEARDLNEALQVAARIPVKKFGNSVDSGTRRSTNDAGKFSPSINL